METSFAKYQDEINANIEGQRAEREAVARKEQEKLERKKARKQQKEEAKKKAEEE